MDGFHLKIDFFDCIQKKMFLILTHVPGNTLFRTPVSEDNFLDSSSPPISDMIFMTEQVADLRCRIRLRTHLLALLYKSKTWPFLQDYLSSEPWPLINNGLGFRKPAEIPSSLLP